MNQSSMKSSNFATDTQISNTQPQIKERKLQKWSDDTPATTSNSQVNLKFTEPWDQFAANERLYNVKSDYVEDMYTTKLDKSSKDFKAKEKIAQKIADEIMSVMQYLFQY